MAFDRVLILETSGRVGQAALASGDTVVATASLAESRRRASDLLPIVRDLLAERGWPPASLSAVAVGLGPGSYTGLRVGLASAKALAYAVRCPFFGVESYSAIALQAGAEAVAVVGDALKGRVFRRDYRLGPDGLAPITDFRIDAIDEWLATLTPGIVVTGPAAGLVADRLPPGIVAMEESRREARPGDLWQVARTCPWAVTTEMWTAEPLYLRGSSAEEKAAGRS